MHKLRFLFLALALPAAAHAALLSVDSAGGAASLSRGDAAAALKKSDELRENDTLKLGAGARLTLGIARHGFADLGPGAELALERLPFASYAADLRTVLRLNSGYLRLVWKHPAQSTSWPLFVYFGNMRASLASGEYFFENNAGNLSMCIAAGEAAVSSVGGSRPEMLQGPACYRLTAGAPPQKVLHDAGDFVTVRENFALGELGAIVSRPPAPATQPSVRSPFYNPPRPQATTVPETKTGEAIAPAAPRPPAPAAVTGPEQVTAAPEPQALPAPVAGDGPWVLNVGSHADQASAESEAQRLREAGYAATVNPAEVKGRRWYRVQLRDLGSADEARALARLFKDKFGYKDAWIIKQ